MEFPPTECLDMFDGFDLDNHRERRLATYALEDYYGTILSNIGTEYLDFSPHDTERGIGSQWNKAKTRLRQVGIETIPDRYNQRIHRLSDIRNSVAHRYQHNPRLDYLNEAREIAEEWFEWFSEQADKYREEAASLTVGETLFNMKLEAFDAALADPSRYDFPKLSERQREINERIKDFVRWSPYISIDLDEFSVARIDPDESFVKKDGEQEYQIERHTLLEYAEALKLKHDVENLIDEEISRKEEVAEPDNPDTRFCEVIDSSGDSIHLLVTNENREFWQNIDYLSDELKQVLSNLQEGDIIETIIGVDRHGELYLKDILRVNP